MAIRGNEIVDKVTKVALSKDIDTDYVPLTDLKLSMQFIHYFGQQDWIASDKKLHTIFPIFYG